MISPISMWGSSLGWERKHVLQQYFTVYVATIYMHRLDCLEIYIFQPKFVQHQFKSIAFVLKKLITTFEQNS